MGETITIDAVECLAIYREARAKHMESGGEGASEPARLLDELVDAVEAAGDPMGAMAFGLLGTILTVGDQGQRHAAFDLLASLPTGHLLMSQIARASQFDAADRERAFRDAARDFRVPSIHDCFGFTPEEIRSTIPGPGRE